MAFDTQSILVQMDGDLPVNPEIRLQPITPRAAGTSAVGWTFRRRYTLTNTGTEAVANHAFPINLGPTNTLVAGGKALASGDDVRVVIDGLEVARTLNNHNAATDAYAWIILSFLDVNEALVVDVLYGNAAAGSPPTLTLGLDKPAHDIADTTASRSTKTFRRYLVDRTVANAGLGGWPLSSGTVEPTPYFGTPNAWKMAATQPSADDKKQAPWQSYVATGTKYQARFDATRARLDALVFNRDTGGDGVSIRSGTGIVSVRADLRYTNLAVGDTDLTPVGQLVVLSRINPGDEWTTVFSQSTLQTTETTIATATYTMPTGTKEVAFAVWPKDGLIIDSAARPDRYVYGAWYTTLELTLSDVITQSGGSEESVYELATEVRVSGGGETSPVAPYRSVYLGNAASASGVDTPRLTLKFDQLVRVFCDTRLAEIWDENLVAKVEDVSLSTVRGVDGVLRSDGTTVEVPSTSWLELTPVTNPLTNPSFQVNAAGWSYGDVTALVVTAPISRGTSSPDSGAGYGQSNVASSTAGANATIEVIADDYLPVGGRQSVWVGMAFRTASTAQNGRPAIWWYDVSQVELSRSDPGAWTAEPGDSLWHRRLFAAQVPENAVYYRVGLVHQEESASGVLDLDFDTVEVNAPELVLKDVAVGSIELTYAFFDRHVGG